MKKIDKEIYYYLKNLFSNLKIEKSGLYKCEFEGNLFDLMLKDRLDGWCWETTETASLFMLDDTIIYRGDLYFSTHKTYFHSFLVFNYKGKNYVFDPCLRLINTFDLYYKIFDVNIKGCVTAKDVKKSFFNSIYKQPEKTDYLKDNEEYVSPTEKFMRKFFGDNYKTPKEINVDYSSEINAPMFLNNSSYVVELENGKIKNMVARYHTNA